LHDNGSVGVGVLVGVVAEEVGVGDFVGVAGGVVVGVPVGGVGVTVVPTGDGVTVASAFTQHPIPSYDGYFQLQYAFGIGSTF
jgi:hypothetical protein